jgi:hypothetical protein
VFNKVYEGSTSRKKENFVWDVGVACKQLREASKGLYDYLHMDGGMTSDFADIEFLFDQL